MPGSVLPILAEYFMSKYSLCCFVLQHFPSTPAKEKVIPCSGESRDILHLLGLLVSSSISIFFLLLLPPSPSPSGTHSLLPHCVSKENFVLGCKARKIKSFTLRHLVSSSNTTCVEQAKLQFSSLLAIVGFIPNLILFLKLQRSKRSWANCLGICGAQSVTIMG
jgi:hypothetical protein